MYKLVIIAAEDIRVYEFNSLSVAEKVRELVIKWNLKAELFEDKLEERKEIKESKSNVEMKL